MKHVKVSNHFYYIFKFTISATSYVMDVKSSESDDVIHKSSFDNKVTQIRCSELSKQRSFNQSENTKCKKFGRQQMYLPLTPDPQMFHRVHPVSKINMYSPVSPMSMFPFRQHELCSPISSSSSSLPSPCSDISVEYNSLTQRLTPDVQQEKVKSDVELPMLTVCTQCFSLVNNLYLSTNDWLIDWLVGV
jgi:hypothetical protein